MILSAFSEIKKKKQTTKQTKKPHKDKQQRQQPHHWEFRDPKDCALL